MGLDWLSDEVILYMLDDAKYKHLDMFMYVELDQWPVSPLQSLEFLFQAAGLVDGGKSMAVVGEYPCSNIRNGGQFNVGNYLFSRSPQTLNILREWNASEAYGGSRDPWPQKFWPARQGAFSVDIFSKFEDVIHVFDSGCPLGSPFGALVGHCTGGDLTGFFNHGKARQILDETLFKCVHRRLSSQDHRACAIYPPWVGAPCVLCEGTRRVGEQWLQYEACCGEIDSALVLEAFDADATSLAASYQEGGKLDLGAIFTYEKYRELFDR